MPAIQANLRETTTRVLASLTPREERVLRMRFGIGMNTDHTLEEVGQQFSVTRERTARSRRRRCAKLKHPSPQPQTAQLPGYLAGVRGSERSRGECQFPASPASVTRAGRPCRRLAARRGVLGAAGAIRLSVLVSRWSKAASCREPPDPSA